MALLAVGALLFVLVVDDTPRLPGVPASSPEDVLAGREFVQRVRDATPVPQPQTSPQSAPAVYHPVRRHSWLDASEGVRSAVYQYREHRLRRDVAENRGQNRPPRAASVSLEPTTSGPKGSSASSDFQIFLQAISIAMADCCLCPTSTSSSLQTVKFFAAQRCRALQLVDVECSVRLITKKAAARAALYNRRKTRLVRSGKQSTG